MSVHDQNKLGEEKVYFGLQAKAEPETVRRGTLLTDLLSYCSYTPQDCLPMRGPAHGELGPPVSISNQENSPQTCYNPV